MKNRGITKKDTEIHKNRNQGRSLPVILTYSGLLPPPHIQGYFIYDVQCSLCQQKILLMLVNRDLLKGRSQMLNPSVYLHVQLWFNYDMNS